MQNVNKLIDNKVTEQRAYLEEKLAAQAKETADRIEMLKQKNYHNFKTVTNSVGELRDSFNTQQKYMHNVESKVDKVMQQNDTVIRLLTQKLQSEQEPYRSDTRYHSQNNLNLHGRNRFNESDKIRHNSESSSYSDNPNEMNRLYSSRSSNQIYQSTRFNSQNSINSGFRSRENSFDDDTR